jgi:hypothetical protein
MSSLSLFAQVGFGGYSIVQVAVLVVVIAAICALVYVALRQFGVTPPAWFIQVCWIVIVAIVVILAILFVARIAGFA